MLAVLEKAKFVDRQAAAPEWKLVHRQSDAAVPALRTVFERAVRAVDNATPWAEIGDRLANGNLDVEDLVPWGSTGSVALFNPSRQVLQDLYLRMGRISSQRLPVFTKRRTLVAGIFQPGHPRAIAWAEQHAADLVVEVANEQRLAIRAAVVRAFEDGLPPRVLARDLRQIVGLTRAQQVAIVKFHSQRIAQGVAANQIVREVDRRALRALRFRTENIARTETIRASVQGQLEGWRQNREARLVSRDLVKEWIVTPDDRLCPICAPLDEVQVDVDGMFNTAVGRVSGPPAHPQCRCAIGLNPQRSRAGRAPVPSPTLVPPFAGPPVQPRLPLGTPTPLRPPPPIAARPPVRAPRRVPPRPTPAPSTTTPLATGDVTKIERMRRGGINGSFKVRMQTADGRTAPGIWKPVSEETWVSQTSGRPVRRTMTNRAFSLAEREELAWKVDQALGTDLVPETVFRTMPAPGRAAEPGSVQFFKRGFVEELDWRGRALTVDERYRFTVLDVIIGNTDRHAKNYMRLDVVGARRGQAIAIDHGYSFPNQTLRPGRLNDPGGFEQFRSEPAGFIREKMPEPLRKRLLDRVQNTNWEPFMTRLSESERAAMKWRLQWIEQRLTRNDFAEAFSDYFGDFGLDAFVVEP